MKQEFHTPEFIRALAHHLELHIGFAGGNVSFILNTGQKRRFTDLGILKAMDDVGRGVQQVQSFRNFNMSNQNYLYNWTFKGK